MRFLRSLADFLSALAFLCCHIFIHILPVSLLALTVCVLPIILIFGTYIILNSSYFSRTHIYFKDTQKEKNTLKWNSNALGKYEYGHLDGWYIKSTLYMTFLNWNKIFEKGKYLVTGKTPFFVIGPFCTPHSIYLNVGFWQSSFVWKCYVVNLSTFN